MSLILEALRRSEAERRRGKVPELLDGGTAPSPPAPVRWPLALAGFLGGLLLAGGLVWWLLPNAAPALPASPSAPSPPPSLPTPQRAAPEPEPPLRPQEHEAPEPIPQRSESPPLPFEASPMPISIPPPAPVPLTNALGAAPGDLALADLAAPLRATLPPLRVSMHVYAEDPARRFAIVDGVRLREGEALVEGLQLIEIRRDGLRLAWQGRSLWVPR